MIAARPSTYKKQDEESLFGRLRRKIEYTKAQLRAKFEYLFRGIKYQFGHTEVRFRGLAKNIAQQTKLFALSNLWTVRKRLLNVGKVHLKCGGIKLPPSSHERAVAVLGQNFSNC